MEAILDLDALGTKNECGGSIAFSSSVLSIIPMLPWYMMVETMLIQEKKEERGRKRIFYLNYMMK